MSRYKKVITNADSHYSDLRQSRGKPSVEQYTTPVFVPIRAGHRTLVQKVKHVWTPGDRYWKLAANYYGNAEFWWVIARYNLAPTEFHVQAGDLIYIPIPLQDALRIVK
jgi:nucleoid-associated protein YgaU